MAWLTDLTDLGSVHLFGAGLLLYTIYCALYPRFLSPLRGIPGPWYALHTQWWLVWKTVKGLRARTIHELHQKYGPWVQIAPSEVSTCDPQAIVPIYSPNSTYVKTGFYIYQLRGVLELFTMSDRKPHARRQRELSHLFSMSTITEYEPVIATHVKG